MVLDTMCRCKVNNLTDGLVFCGKGFPWGYEKEKKNNYAFNLNNYAFNCAYPPL